MAINNGFESKSSTEQRTFKGGMTMSKMRPTDNQVLRTNQKPTRMKSTEKTTEQSTSKVYQVDHDSIEAAYQEHNHEVDRIVTEADFQR